MRLVEVTHRLIVVATESGDLRALVIGHWLREVVDPSRHAVLVVDVLAVVFVDLALDTVVEHRVECGDVVIGNDPVLRCCVITACKRLTARTSSLYLSVAVISVSWGVIGDTNKSGGTVRRRIRVHADR